MGAIEHLVHYFDHFELTRPSGESAGEEPGVKE
jgi:hypothetical protein